jgi:hypothetical protein
MWEPEISSRPCWTSRKNYRIYGCLDITLHPDLDTLGQRLDTLRVQPDVRILEIQTTSLVLVRED